MFRVGQKVTMKPEMGNVWRLEFGSAPRGPTPVVGEVYTVIGFEGWILHPGVRFLRLSEIAYGCFNTNRFRPVVDRNTDISVFTAMLTPEVEKV